MNLIQVDYEYTTTSYTAHKIITEIKKLNTIAVDFEVAIRYSSEQLQEWQLLLDSGKLSKAEASVYLSRVKATALDHPSHCTITHCSIATSDNQAYVFILDNKSITNYVLNYLVTTKQKQIWHNSSYDFRFLHYFTKRFPKDYEDTALLAKTLLNHVETFKARVGLKELAGHMYGAWGISTENFDVAHMYDPHVLLYAATDACATMRLWNYINAECDAIDSKVED